jgi:WD40 repeat protein
VACFNEENQVVILDQETGDQKEIEAKEPLRCAASQHYAAIATFEDGIHMFSLDGVRAQSVPYSAEAMSVAFHPHNTNILAIGCKDGLLHIWDVSTQSYVSSFKQHSDGITAVRFTPDYHLFLSSWDHTASIVSLDEQFEYVSSVKFEGHTFWVNNILPLPSSNQCVTCSNDSTVRVWDCETGVCLRTLTEHRDSVASIAMHPSGLHFASGSYDETVIIWSSETFEVLHRTQFPSLVHSLMFVESDTLYVGMYEHGVMSCSVLTGKVGPVIMTGTGCITDISLGQ